MKGVLAYIWAAHSMKWILLSAFAVFLVLGATVPLSSLMVNKGIEHSEKSWAPGLTQKGARLRMLFGNYGIAARIWENAANTWPDHPDCPKMVYRVAFCLEKAKQTNQAIGWYEKFLATYPEHSWRSQAERRVAQLKEGR